MKRALALSLLVLGCKEPRSAPPQADASAPLVPNHTLMLAIADGTLPFSRLVDPRAGVVLVDESADASGGRSGIQREAPGVRCGSALAALLDSWQKQLADKKSGLRATYDEQRLTCRTTPDPACVWRGRAEWSPTVHFLFRDDPSRGLVLRAIVLLDELAVDPETVAAKRRKAMADVARLETAGCPR